MARTAAPRIVAVLAVVAASGCGLLFNFNDYQDQGAQPGAAGSTSAGGFGGAPPDGSVGGSGGVSGKAGAAGASGGKAGTSGAAGSSSTGGMAGSSAAGGAAGAAGSAAGGAGGTVGPGENGASCDLSSDCLSSQCWKWAGAAVCCSEPCTAPCHVCDAQWSGVASGTCANAPSGTNFAADGCGTIKVCGFNGLCACADGVKDFLETDVDCGGGACDAKCQQGKGCNNDNDCTTQHCEDNAQGPTPPLRVCCSSSCPDVGCRADGSSCFGGS